VTSFENVLLSCKSRGDFEPAWQCFANTYFFVPVLRNDSGEQTKDFRFSISTYPQDGKPYVLVSEVLDRLQISQSSEAIREIGGKLIAMLNPELGLIIGLNDGGFAMPADLLGWLRASLQRVAP